MFPFRFAFAACALLLLACAGGPSNEDETRTDAPAMSPLEQGRVLYAAKCDDCHVLPGPGAHTPENWDRILNRMKVEARLTPREDYLVRTYIISSAARIQDSLASR